ncbi:uncharacterized protein VTP21DRAFT_4079 [Calcarisporiella thermophila]|uniref:uncharacterized protein n=1 Tax=Calcarisporiella thermophila TaxID=911321 RepID=UPI003742BB3B
MLRYPLFFSAVGDRLYLDLFEDVYLSKDRVEASIRWLGLGQELSNSLCPRNEIVLDGFMRLIQHDIDQKASLSIQYEPHFFEPRTAMAKSQRGEESEGRSGTR